MKYVIEGLPQQQERPRAKVIKKGGKYTATVYDPPKSRKAKEYIRSYLQLQYNPNPLEVPLKMITRIYVPIPKSYTKKQRKMIEEGSLLPAKKPDVSNYIKLIEDACNTLLYKDDSQIVVIEASKHYGDVPRIEIQLEELL